MSLGKNSGLRTLLVGTGVHSLEDVRQWEQEESDDLVPDYYIDSLGDLCKMVRSAKKSN